MIDEETIELVKDKLVQAYHPLEIYLFGSYAWGTPDDESDLDIVVIVDKSDEKIYKRPIKGSDALKGLEISKDLIVYTKAEFEERASHISALCYKIKNKGKKLYEASI